MRLCRGVVPRPRGHGAPAPLDTRQPYGHRTDRHEPAAFLLVVCAHRTPPRRCTGLSAEERAVQVKEAAIEATSASREAAEAWGALATHAAKHAAECRHGAELAERTRRRWAHSG